SIVLASTSSDASVSQFSKANEAGIEMIMIDTEVETDEYSTFIATNNVDAGAEAAEAFVAELESQNKDLEGEVAIISDLAGVQTLIDRNEGFVDRLEELAPDIKVMETRHADNDVTKALSAAEDVITNNPDVLGFFGDSNVVGIGVARALEGQGLAGEKPLVAFDADSEEVEAVKAGSISALIVQDPFKMGYEGVYNAYNLLEGEEVEKRQD